MADRYSSVPSRPARSKKARTPGLVFCRLRDSLITSVSTRYMSASPIGLLPHEVAVLADVRYLGKHIRQGFARRPLQGRLENLAMLLLCTAVALCRPLFQRTHEFLGKVSNHQLRHWHLPFRR